MRNAIPFVPAIALASLVTLVGCKEEQKQTPKACGQPGAGRAVPLRVIRVLDDNSDSIGNQNNKGCRLTDLQIQQYIGQAQAFYKQSCNIDIQWDGSIRLLRWDLDDTSLFGLPARNGRSFTWFMLNELQDNTHYSSNHLNIFFHGNLKIDTTHDGQGNFSFNANTVDPSDEGPLGSAGLTARRHLLVNDRGGVSGNGMFVSADGVLEHELAHWFLRQKSTQGGRYDQFEHCGTTCTTIMKSNPPHPPAFIESPPSICERFEIWTQAGDWNNP